MRSAAVAHGDGTGATVVPDVESAEVLGRGDEIGDPDVKAPGKKGILCGGNVQRTGGGEYRVVASARKLGKGVPNLSLDGGVVYDDAIPVGQDVLHGDDVFESLGEVMPSNVGGALQGDTAALVPEGQRFVVRSAMA